MDEDYEFDPTPPDLKDAVERRKAKLYAHKSRNRYEKSYQEYVVYCASKKIKRAEYHQDEHLLDYATELSDRLSASTAAGRISMIKKGIQVHNPGTTAETSSAAQWLKREKDQQPVKKAAVFTEEEIAKFLETAPEPEFRNPKVAIILSIFGALRKCELLDLTVDDIKSNALGSYTITVRPFKVPVERKFDLPVKFAKFLKVYFLARPAGGDTPKRVLLGHNKKTGALVRQVVGKNSVALYPRIIAQFLHLPDEEQYTGHSFRRTAATWASNAGMSLTELKQLGGWKSDSIAYSYIAESARGRHDRALALCTNLPLGEMPTGNPATPPPEQVQEKQPPAAPVVAPTHIVTITGGTFTNCTIMIYPPK